AVERRPERLARADTGRQDEGTGGTAERAVTPRADREPIRSSTQRPREHQYSVLQSITMSYDAVGRDRRRPPSVNVEGGLRPASSTPRGKRLSAPTAACSRAASHRCRSGEDGRSWWPGPTSSPASARSNRAGVPERTAR